MGFGNGGTGGLGGAPGNSAGNDDLTEMVFGGGGGAGSSGPTYPNQNRGGPGGNGGGIIFISAKTLNVLGLISSAGENGGNAAGEQAGGGGAGAAGSIFINAQTATLGSDLITAIGATTGGTGDLGIGVGGYPGANGRIVLDYYSYYSGTANPSLYAVQMPPSFLLNSSDNPSGYGQPITFTASLNPIPDGGTIQFQYNGNNLSDPLSINASGQVTFTTSSLAVGTQTITAIYSGDTNYMGSTGSLTQTVNQVVIMNTISLPDGVGDTNYSPQILSASGGTGNYTWTIVSGTLPDNFTLSSAGIISGQTVHAYPPSPHTYTFTVQATDSTGDIATQQLSITVTCPRWDINVDGVCNYLDLTLLGIYYGQSGTPGWIPEDINQDGVVNYLDLTELGIYYGDSW
jgi:hypothetical protein